MLPALLGGIGVTGAAVWAGFQTMWPTSQVCGRTFIGLEPGSRLLALTYDDGPNDPYTWRMMEVLERHGVKATFFLIGQFVRQKPEIARALVASGHAIGSHTWDHPNLIFASRAEVRATAGADAAGHLRRDRGGEQAVPAAVRRAAPGDAACHSQSWARTRHVERHLL